MAIALSGISLYVAIGLPIIGMMGMLAFMISIHKAVPWAWPMYRCYQKNLPCAFNHYPKGRLEIEIPKVSKDLKTGVPVTYFEIKNWGYKVPDLSGDNTELLNGKLRVVHFFKNGVAPISCMSVLALDRMKSWMNSKGLNITNYEDVVLFFLNDYERTKNIKKQLEESSVDDEETRKFILKTIDIIEKNRSELNNLKVKDGLFTFQTAMMALDRTVAFTSSAFSNAKSAIEAQIRAKQLEDKNKEMGRTIILVVILLVGAAIAYAIISKSGALT